MRIWWLYVIIFLEKIELKDSFVEALWSHIMLVGLEVNWTTLLEA